MNVSQSYLPLYLTETLQFEKVSKFGRVCYLVMVVLLMVNYIVHGSDSQSHLG